MSTSGPDGKASPRHAPPPPVEGIAPGHGLGPALFRPVAKGAPLNRQSPLPLVPMNHNQPTASPFPLTSKLAFGT